MVAYNNALYVFGGDDGYVTKSSGLRQRKIVISDSLIISIGLIFASSAELSVFSNCVNYFIILLSRTPDYFTLSNARQIYLSRGERWHLMVQPKYLPMCIIVNPLSTGTGILPLVSKIIRRLDRVKS